MVEGPTLRVIEVDHVVSVTPSDQVTVNGAVPVKVAVTFVVAPSQYDPPPLTTAVGVVRGVTTALPLATPLQPALVIEVMLYVVIVDGETERVAVVPVTCCVKPSDQRMSNGPVPVSVAVIVTGEPGQYEPPPLTDAVGGATGVAVALPLDVPLAQLASEICATV